MTPRRDRGDRRRWSGEGFRAVKFGWGPMGLSEASDIAHVVAARKGIGTDCELMVDAGLCWDTATAIHRARQFEEYNLGSAGRAAAPEQCQGLRQAQRRRRCESRPARKSATSRSFNS